MTNKEPLPRPETFLNVFRRRGILVSALKLSFLAAFLNEITRWAAIFSNLQFGTDLPVLTTGPLVFVVLLAVAIRKWSPSHTAAYADALLDFRDRFTSFVDFSKRDDLPPLLVAAQKEEVSTALRNAGGLIPPLKPLLCAGPLVLLLGVIYPDFVMPPYAPPLHQSSPPEASLPDTSHSSGPSEGDTADSAEGRDNSDEEPATAEKEASEEGGETAEAEPAPAAASDGASPDDDSGAGGFGEVPGLSSSENPFEKTGPLSSERIGKALSKVVDPVFAPDGKAAEPAELPRGSMTYRLLPHTVSGEGERGGKSIAEAEASRIVVDFEEIPEKYRAIVSAYYTLLAGDQRNPVTVEGKEQP